MSLSLSTGIPPASAEHTTCAPNVQFLGFSDALNKSKFGGFDVTELSGLTYDDRRGVYYAVADRAGATPTHVFTLDISVGSEAVGPLRVLGATVLNTDPGTPFTGFTFDGEGIALTRGDELLVASESGSAAGEQPEIRRFSLNGSYLGELSVASRFLIGPNNLSFESLALSPNGHRLFTANEGPLAADGRTGDLRSRVRIVRYEDRGAQGFVPAQEYLYLTEPGRTTGDLGVVELIALSEEDLLVLERGFVANQGNTIRAFRVSVRNAADVSNIPSLSAGEPVPLTKSLLFDLVNCPASGAKTPGTQPNPLLDNFEAMTLGPQLPGGRRALLLMSDDNAGDTQVTRVVALAIPTATATVDLLFLNHPGIGLPEQDVFIDRFGAPATLGVRVEASDAHQGYNLSREAFASAAPLEHDPFKLGSNPTGPYLKGRSLGFTLGQWLDGSAIGTYTLDGNLAEVTVNARRLVPNSAYTVWCSQVSFPPNFKIVDEPCGAPDGSQHIFRTDAQGNGSLTVKAKPLPPTTATATGVIALAYHSDGKTYGAYPGDFGLNSHVQLAAFLPPPATTPTALPRTGEPDLGTAVAAMALSGALAIMAGVWFRRRAVAR